jgi:membrane protein DedA with SNARE-associated domain
VKAPANFRAIYPIVIHGIFHADLDGSLTARTVQLGRTRRTSEEVVMGSAMLTGILDHAEWVVFVLILANQAGVPVFAAPVLVGVGALASNGDVSVARLLTVAIAGALSADLAWYGLAWWRGAWALSALRRLSHKAGALVDEAQRVFGVHDRAFQFGARFLPELNPVAAAFAGVGRVGLGRFVGGAAASALVWASTWVGAGYLIGGAMGDTATVGIPLFAVIVTASAFASLILLIRPARRLGRSPC